LKRLPVKVIALFFYPHSNLVAYPRDLLMVSFCYFSLFLLVFTEKVVILQRIN